jgi:hypothetical protein
MLWWLSLRHHKIPKILAIALAFDTFAPKPAGTPV